MLNNISYTMKEAGKAKLEVDGQEIGGFRSVRMSVDMDSFPTVDVEMLALPQWFDVQGRFEPLLELPDIEEDAARDLYIRLRDRFAAEDLLPGEDGG